MGWSRRGKFKENHNGGERKEKDETEAVRERFQRSVSCVGEKRRVREKMCIVVQEACALRKNMPVYEYEQTSTAMQ